MSQCIKERLSFYWCKYRQQKKLNLIVHILYIVCLSNIFIGLNTGLALGQSSATSYTSGNQQSKNYLSNSVAFRQEIARMEMNVVRGGKFLPITQVPRVEKDDVIKVRMLDEAVGGIKPDQSNWDWTFLVAFVNPNRNNDKQKSVSEEIRFRKTGWYKEYSFQVPYDSQPVFFLYPKANYRGKILNLVNKNFEEVRKLGEKTIEIAGAYAQINSFLNELQFVLYQTQYSRYGQFVTYPAIPGTTNPYNQYNPYNPYGSYNPYNPSGSNQNNLTPIYNYNALMEQTIERLARSFNISLPSCWQSSNGGINYNSYGGYQSGSYGGYGGSTGSYSSYGNYSSSYGSSNNPYGYTVGPDLIGRAQCVAKNVRLEDFDVSLASVLKQGGIFALTQLRDKYPQLSYWISIAAVALDFIVKAFQKMPLRIVPAIIQSSDNLGQNNSYQSSSSSSYYTSLYQSGSGYSSPKIADSQTTEPVKIALYAESQPGDNQFVSAYPIVIQKWQQEPDPEVISLRSPVLAEPCLHAGVNLLKNSDLSGDLSADTYTKDFKLVISDENGFRKVFPLRKNMGLGGWELSLTNEDLNSIPKIKMTLEAEMTGTRGFNELKSPKFDLPISIGGNWQIKPESQAAFAVGGKRRVTIQNTLGSCRCLQAVIYKPSFGGQFVFEANSKSENNQLEFSANGREVSFQIDAKHFQPGQGTLEIKTYGDQQPQQTNQGQQSNILPIKLYPLPPNITDVKISKGDKIAIISGERLEQLQFVKINGKRATIIKNNQAAGSNYGSQPNGASPSQNQNLDLNLSLNQRAAIFDEANVRQTTAPLSLELGLEDNRQFTYPQTFNVGVARPTIEANDLNEIEGVFIESSTSLGQLKLNTLLPSNIAKDVVTINAAQLSVVVRNKLTDYDFRGENISVETKIENSQLGAVESPQVSFDVLDANSLRLNFQFTEQSKKFIGSRRLQFRLRDRQRGDSDWYTIRQTFVRIPQIESITCTRNLNGQCELKGVGIDYIGQVSVDGGMSWYPGEGRMLSAQVSTDGKTVALIPILSNKKLLYIKLRDYPKTEGISAATFILTNVVKNTDRIK